MQRLLIFPLIISISLFVLSVPVNANTEFDKYMNDFYKKQEMATNLLKEIETDLKGGSRERICARQKKAATYGIEGTQSLIKAFKISGTMTEMNNIQAGLDKWRELRDYC